MRTSLKTTLKLAFMAMTQDLDTGQFLAYLFIFFLPFINRSLLLQVIPRDPLELRFLCKALIQGQPWAIRGAHHPWPHKKVKRHRKPSVSIVCEGVNATNNLRTHLFSLAMATFRVSCRVEHFLCCLGRLGRPLTRFTAMTGEAGAHLDPYMRFDSDSVWISVDNHASFCIANSPHLFEDLRLVEQGTQVQGIGKGLQVKGTGTFVMRINDDNGKTHEVKIPNSLYLPDLQVLT
jgi:hypothetical protein